jgi:hypothetical protein
VAISSKIKELLNAGLALVNLRVETRTREKEENLRLEALRSIGHFNRPAFPLPPSFLSASAQVVFDNLAMHHARFETFQDMTANDVGYSFDNDYFSSPDAEVLYTLTRHFQPRRIIEVGSGYSTRIARQAIKDGNLPTRLISIDPCPRREVMEICDEGICEPVEFGCAKGKLRQLRAGDFLFIDSSHEVKTGNDVVYLFLNVLPQLESGVLVHVHDITLPWDYPCEWLMEQHWAWTEQYLVQMMLGSGEMFEVIWPGHFLQRTQPEFQTYFPFGARRTAFSLWLRKAK